MHSLLVLDELFSFQVGETEDAEPATVAASDPSPSHSESQNPAAETTQVQLPETSKTHAADPEVHANEPSQSSSTKVRHWIASL